MSTKTPVTQGEDLAVTEADVYNSEWGGLFATRQKIFPTERVSTIIADWIELAKNDVVRGCGRTWASIVAVDSDKKEAKQVVLMMVGVKALRRAQAARTDVTESDYTRQTVLLQEDIDNKLLNLETQCSAVTVSNVEPDLVDPDSDYDYD